MPVNNYPIIILLRLVLRQKLKEIEEIKQILSFYEGRSEKFTGIM